MIKVRRIGHALGSLAVEQGQTAIAVGRDGRLSGPELAGALMDGICAAGGDAIDVGCVPPPVTYFSASALGGNQFTQAIANVLNLTFDEAETLKIRVGLPSLDGSAAPPVGVDPETARVAALRPGQLDAQEGAHRRAAGRSPRWPPPGAAGRTGTPRAARNSLAAAMVCVP